MDIYNDYYDFEIYGFPGEFIFSDVYYTEPGEVWKRDKDFPDYWVSNFGNVWSYVSNDFIHGSPTGRCGHIDMLLHYNGKRYHKYLHQMVAEAFIPNPNNYPIVRHLDDDPTNNYVDNLAWGTQLDNVRDCIKNKRFRYFDDDDRELAMQKRRMPITSVNLRNGQKRSYISQQEAARQLGFSQSSISSVIRGKNSNINGYYFYNSDEECKIDLTKYKYKIHNALIKATVINTGEEFIFRGQTEAARVLGLSIASVSMVLSGKMKTARGYIFEYVDEEEYNGYN